jgi:DNA-binding LacI/PurR family transcriptional regulator
MTAVEGAWRERGEHAVDVLLTRLRGERDETEPPSLQLVVRESTGPRAAR